MKSYLLINVFTSSWLNSFCLKIYWNSRRNSILVTPGGEIVDVRLRKLWKIWIWFYQINCVLSNHSKVQGPVVRGPISTSSRLNLGLLIPLFKSHFGIVFCVLFRASNSHIPDKKKFDWIFLKAFRSEIIFHTKPGLT